MPDYRYTGLSFVDMCLLRKTLFYARKAALNSKRLNTLNRQELGFRVKQLVQQRLLLAAKRRISYGNQTFKSIAFGLGFKDTSYFSRFFRQNTGMTPEEFRESLMPHRPANRLSGNLG